MNIVSMKFEEVRHQVCVKCMTYNQSAFIIECMDGFCSQQTNFPFVCTIVDDASTDGEQEVICNYLRENFCHEDCGCFYQEKTDFGTIIYAQHKSNINCYFVVILLKENHYQQKKSKQQYLDEWAKNIPLIAICEGDDYWTDPIKLQKQRDFLVKHTEYSAITSNSQMIAIDGKVIAPFSYSPSRDIVSINQLVQQRQFHTASILYRKSKLDASCYFSEKSRWDTWLFCCLVSMGPIRYVDEVQCVYRLGSGVTTTTPKYEWCLIQEKWTKQLIKNFYPDQLSWESVCEPLLSDVLSTLNNSRLSSEEKRVLKLMFRRYVNLLIIVKLRKQIIAMPVVKIRRLFLKYIRALKNRFLYLFDIFRNIYTILFMKAPRIMSREETIDFIVKNKCSVSRNGDGEIFIMTGRDIDFQKYEPRLANLLKMALSEQNEKYLPCLINVFENPEYKRVTNKTYYSNHLRKFRYFWYKFTNHNFLYGDSNITRFYSKTTDVDKAKIIISSLRRIWEKRDLLIIEGIQSRLGVGNDLFANAGKIRRILVPSVNAFDKYDDIKEAAKQYSSPQELIFLAIGPTATALAYDLYKDGYWAIDIGHVDICYEWYIRGVSRGFNVPGKFTNEADGSKFEGEIQTGDMQIYQNQIVKTII